jgi:two-component system response regulator
MTSKDLIAKPIHVLLVEDNPDDIELTREALKESRMHVDLDVVTDGEQAMDYLNAQGEWEDRTLPDLVLLDLNLPRKDGREVLQDIKSDQKLRRIPVVVLTISQDDQDVLQAYDLYANCYITKPVDFDQFLTVVRNIEDFWLTVVKLPG